MKLIPKKSEGEVCGWNSDDAAALYIWRNDHDIDNAHWSTPPIEFEGVHIGSSVSLQPQVIIPLERLTFIGAGLFGAARGKGPVKWSGNAYRFGVYIYASGLINRKAVIVEQNGGGIFAYMIDELDSDKTWARLCELSSPELLWDLCMTVTKTYRSGIADGQKNVERLFLAGRLRRQSRQGITRMRVIPETQTIARIRA